MHPDKEKTQQQISADQKQAFKEGEMDNTVKINQSNKDEKILIENNTQQVSDNKEQGI